MAKLSEQQEKFCRNVVEGMNASDAYRAADYKCTTDEAVWAAASRLLGNVKVAQRIDELRKAAQKHTELTAAAFAKRLDRLATAAEKAALSETDEFASKEAADVMRASIMDAAKLLGLIVDQSKVQSENVHFTVSDSPMSEDEWETEYGSEESLEPAARTSGSLN
jgi:phage terminase small subunit